jgi:hypothetical protein
MSRTRTCCTARRASASGSRAAVAMSPCSCVAACTNVLCDKKETFFAYEKLIIEVPILRFYGVSCNMQCCEMWIHLNISFGSGSAILYYGSESHLITDTAGSGS